ncbi:MAG: DNA polymerase III subunit chi, partial [Pseudomonadota bacterium]|nr:DNA polymerase III subunit chi [Pseudomonadota bacterium]
MTEVLFYHLERQTLEQVLPRLVQASLGRDWRVVVKAGSPERIQALNTHLWTWADDVFLPHAAVGDARFTEFAADQPVWLTHEDDVPNDA